MRKVVTVIESANPYSQYRYAVVTRFYHTDGSLFLFDYYHTNNPK